MHFRNPVVATAAVSRLLLWDLKHSKQNKTMYPFTLRVPQHPFIVILNQNKHSWRTVLNEMTFFLNHWDPQYVQKCVNSMYRECLYIYACTLKIQVFQNQRT